MRTGLTLHVLVTALLVGLASAQSPIVVLRVGDPVPGAGHVTDIEVAEVDASGQWVALVHTDDPVAHTVLFANGGPYVKTGDTPAGLAGASLASLEASTQDLFLFPTYLARLSGATARQAVMHYQSAQFLTGEPATVYTSQLPSGSTWRHFDDVHFAWNNAGYLLRGSIDDPVGGRSDLGFAGLVWHIYPGLISEVVVIALEGEPAPGLARSIDEVRTAPTQGRLNGSAGRALWSCDLDGSTADDGCVYASGTAFPVQSTLLVREGSPSPVPGRVWGPLEDIALDLNSDDDWTLRGQLDASDPTNDEVLVKNGRVLAREGEPLPATSPFPLQSLGQGRGALDDNGRVLWYGRWDDPTTAGEDEALFIDGLPLVRTGATPIAGSVLTDIESGPRSYAVDPDHGRYLAFVGSLADGTRGLFLLDQGGMRVYCTAKVNSLGFTPAIWWDGQPPSATAGSGFEIHTWRLMPQSPAVFLYGTDGPLAMPFHGGFLCVNTPLHRGPLVDTGGSTQASGKASFDFNAWIASGVDPTLVAGQQVHLQLWYRDSGFPKPDDVGLTPGISFWIGP